MKIVFFRTPKPRRFHHKNIYYDPEKEEREERENRVNKKLGLNEEDKPFVTSIRRGSFRRGMFDSEGMITHDELARDRRMKTARSIIIIVASLLFAAYIIATSGDYLALF